jgi:hypothetical protein
VGGQDRSSTELRGVGADIRSGRERLRAVQRQFKMHAQRVIIASVLPIYFHDISGIRHKRLLSRIGAGVTRIDWPAAIVETQRFIDGVPAAKAAFNELVARGCERERILRALYRYCGGGTDTVQTAKREFARKRSQLLNLVTRLEKRVIPDLTEAESILHDAGIEISSSFVSDTIRSYADLLRGLTDAVLGRPASGRVTGRDHHLRFLAEMVKIVTGREHYAELAELIGAVQLGYTGKPETRTAENIGKLIRRLRRQTPLEFEYSQELDELKSLSTGKHRNSSR